MLLQAFIVKEDPSRIPLHLLAHVQASLSTWKQNCAMDKRLQNGPTTAWIPNFQLFTSIRHNCAEENFL